MLSSVIRLFREMREVLIPPTFEVSSGLVDRHCDIGGISG